MLPDGFLGLALGAAGLGLVHGVEPGHGWPVAAAYALDRSNTWISGLAASTILGVGHLVSSIAMVAVFFWAKSALGLTEVGWMNYVAGGLLLLLGLREYRNYRSGGGHHHGHSHSRDGRDHSHEVGHSRGHGHSHGDGRSDGHEHSHDHVYSDSHHVHDDSHNHHDHDDESHHHGSGHSDADSPGHSHGHGADQEPRDADYGQPGIASRIRRAIPVGQDHAHLDPDEAADRGILGIAAFAFALGFAHEEEFEIIAICAGSEYCLELMLVYALTVVAAIVGFTLLLIAGYEHYEERVAAYAPYLPLFSAVVLVVMGLGFLAGVF